MQIAFLAAGCGHTRLREVHTYIARDAAANEVSFVRVTIDAESTGSETQYQARWKPAAAVDEFFNAETAPPRQENEGGTAEVRKAQHDIVDGLTRKLVAASEADRQEAAQDLERRLAAALGLERRLAAKQTTDASEAPAQKFVIVWSANPDAVFDQIAQVVEKQESEGAILDTVAALRRGEEENARTQDVSAETLWNALLKGVSSMKRDVAPSATADALKKSQLELAANLEIYRRRLRDFLEGAR